MLGGQRCGTTSLYLSLKAHPKIRGALMKEVQYFTANYEKGVGWYRSCFPAVAPGFFTFEASPSYLFDERAAARAATVLPRAKFVAVLREPAARAYSHYLHNSAQGWEPLSFADAIAAEPGRLAAACAPGNCRDHEACSRYSYFRRGLYAEQLSRWQSHVGAARIHVLRSDDLFRDPRGTMGRLLDFLEIPGDPPDELAHANALGSGQPLDPVDAAVCEELRRRFAVPNEQLTRLLGWTHAWGPGA